MGTLLLLTLLSTTTTPPSTLTPEQEVEAWDPLDDRVVEARDPANAEANDNGSQAADAALVVVGGLGAGAVGAVAAGGVAIVAGPLSPVLLLLAAGLFVAGPAVFVALFTDLPPSTPWAVAVSVVVGGLAGGLSGFLAFSAYVRANYAGSDCVCGQDVFVAFAAVPVGALIGAGFGGVASTTIAAFSE